MKDFTSCFVSFAENFDLNLTNISKFLERGTGIGKILKKLKLSDEDVQSGVLAFRSAEFAAQIQMAEDATDIKAAYSCIKSCMTNFSEECGKFYSNPTLVEQGVRVALFYQNEQIMGRCVVNINTMRRNPHYTVIGHEEFAVGLTELGYQFYDDSSCSALSEVQIPDNPFYPYFDGTGYLVHSNSGSYILEALGDDRLDFSEVEAEVITSEFEMNGHSVSTSELWIWSGCYWLNYGQLHSDSNLRDDWEMTITRTDKGYLSNGDKSAETEYGSCGKIDELFIFDDYGDLIATDKYQELYPHNVSQYHEIPGIFPWSADEKPLCPGQKWAVKEKLWWHSEVGVICYNALLSKN